MRRPQLWTRGIAGIVACTAIGGCQPASPANSGGVGPVAMPPPATAQAPTGAVACAALTAAKVSAALNTTATLSESHADTGGQSFCTYSFSPAGKARVQVVIGADASAQYEAFKSGVTDFTDVAGVGDRAFDSGQGFGAIQANRFVAVIGGLPGDADSRKQLAQAMLAALAAGP